MKKEYIKPEVKEVLTDCEELLDSYGFYNSGDGGQLSKGNSSFDKDDSDWDD